jgi:hypothetical protein
MRRKNDKVSDEDLEKVLIVLERIERFLKEHDILKEEKHE